MNGIGLHRVAIVGGGIAGLTAAFTLRRLSPRTQCDLFEASARWGGAIRTERLDGFLVEHGADMFATEPNAAMELCDELGLQAELQTPLPNARGAAIVHRGKLVPIPAGFVLMRPTRLWPMMTTPLLSLAAKLRLLAEPLIARRGEALDESIASFVTRRLGRETLARIVQPLVGGIYTGDVSRLSMAAAMPQFWEMERRDGSLFQATRRRHREGADTTEQNSAGARYEKFRSFPDGMQRLIDALVSQLEVKQLHLSSPVRELRKTTEGWQLIFNSQRELGPYQQVIVATPAGHASELIAKLAPAARLALSEIAFASSAIVVLGVHSEDIEQRLSIAGFVVPAGELRNVLAVSFTGDKFAGRAPLGQKLIRVFIGGEMQAHLLARNDDELIELAKVELNQLIGLRGQPILAKVIRWNHAMPQYHVGHLQRLATIKQSLSEHSGLSLIGNSLHGVGIAPTIANARQTVQDLHRVFAGLF